MERKFAVTVEFVMEAGDDEGAAANLESSLTSCLKGFQWRVVGVQPHSYDK